MNKQQIILHLSLINGVGPTTAWRLLQILSTQQDFLNLYNLSSLELGFKFGLPPKVSSLIYEGLKDKSSLELELKLIEKHKINWITLIDEEYPAILKNSYLPPLVIYYKGSNIFKEKSIAVIGSRKINDYGIRAINKIVPELVKNDWVIISGGAIGADTKAHETAVKAGGKTVAILGSGLLHPYPYSNLRLFEEIIAKGGAIISSFHLNMQPFASNFPARNRIIAGISKGCLVVQAAIKSGTRITATFALEQGKEVFAIPGSIEDELSAGCHVLIKEGAKLVHSAQDIFIEFGEADKESHTVQAKKEFNPPVVSAFEAIVSSHQPEEEELVKLCYLPASIDELLEKTGLNLQELQSKLFELELDDKIKQDFAGMWQKI
ncbi:MAG: DNA-processing protein DprA [Candidatus Babeliales bacterium]|nr:DNA-processing protein DprA [Candidatus Babeliales bacterium]